MFLTLNHICPNNLPFWQSVTKPQQTNEYMREDINHSTLGTGIPLLVITCCNNSEFSGVVTLKSPGGVFTV